MVKNGLDPFILKLNKRGTQGIKSATLEIANLALLILCMEFEIFVAKYLHLKYYKYSITRLCP